MRVTLKLTAIWIATLVVIITTTALVHYYALVDVVDRETVEEQHVLSNALAPAILEIWRTSGKARALEYVTVADFKRPNTTMTLEPSTTPLDSSREIYLATTTVDQGIALTETDILTPLGPWRLTLRTETEARRDRIFNLIEWTAALALLLMLLGSIIAAIAGHRIVGRRSRALHTAVMRVGDGKASEFEPIEVIGDDEIAALGRAFNMMTARLERASTRIMSDKRKRARMQADLRHADRLAAVGKLASAMAHEIATPLNVIAGYAQMLPDLDDEEERAEIKTIILTQSERISEHIRALLDYSRRKKSVASTLKADDCFHEVQLLMAPLLDDRGVTLTLGTCSDVGFIGSPQLVTEVLTNLITNACNVMPRGGAIELSADSGTAISPPAFRAGEHVFLRVKDSGPGMDDATRKKLFRPFYTTSNEGEGTGLGLSICLEIMEEHEGFLAVESQVGEGATFIAGFPSAKATSA